ncbi:MAG: hypothetical protein PF450_13670 [Bacteroidales bacterium]|nr:hypothetical protein [Bacteroidales bacterium]
MVGGSRESDEDIIGPQVGRRRLGDGEIWGPDTRALGEGIQKDIDENWD